MSDFKTLLSRGVAEIITKESLEKKLSSGKKLRVKLGIDPTASEIHLGNAVVLRKLRQFQDLGHKIILIIGDFTATIGDPSGRSEARKPLTESEIKQNMANYNQQLVKILDLEKTEICYNSTWYKKLGPLFLFDLASKFTVATITEREDFQKRLAEKKDLSMLELIYPLLQGYDSVWVRADVEVGGLDQKFNLLTGRKVQRRFGMPEQDILLTPLLIGTDGEKKMSKSFGNYIGIGEPAEQMFGKIMSIPDKLIVSYFQLSTDITEEGIKIIKKELEEGKNPRNIKMKLAKLIVETYYDSETAQDLAEEFNRVFKEGELPKKIPIIKLASKDKINILDLMAKSKLVSSKSEARRLIRQGGVSYQIQNSKFKIQKSGQEIIPQEGMVLQVGKRKFVKISLKND